MSFCLTCQSLLLPHSSEIGMSNKRNQHFQLELEMIIKQLHALFRALVKYYSNVIIISTSIQYNCDVDTVYVQD